MTTDHAPQRRACGHATVTGAVLNRLAISATTHCLTGCGIGETSAWPSTASVVATSWSRRRRHEVFGDGFLSPRRFWTRSP